MRVLFYADWPLALTYLEPVYRYLRSATDWDLVAYLADKPRQNKEARKDAEARGIEFTQDLSDYDYAITTDTLSACPERNRIVIFHGLASKSQDFSFHRRGQMPKTDVYVSPSTYYSRLLIERQGIDSSRIIGFGLAKFDTITHIPPPNPIPRILYAPTHNPKLTSIGILGPEIYELGDITVHLHMYTRLYPRLKAQKELFHSHDSREDITDLMVHSDIIIGDLGSTVVEGLALGKMVIQVISPTAMKFHQDRGTGYFDFELLPEVFLPTKYGYSVFDMEGVKDAIAQWPKRPSIDLEIVQNIGNFQVSEQIRKYLVSR